MMGTNENQDSFFTYNVNLDKRVRADNPLRKVKEFIDFSFVREEVRQYYGDVGNPSVDPEVVLKMMFLLFFDNVPSERKLMDIIAERLDYRWFLGYDLDSGGTSYYGGNKNKCLACHLREQCTRAKYGRTVMRHVDHDLVVKGRAESASCAAKRDRVRRKHIAEGNFANAANNHGFKRSRWRRLWRQKIQDYLIAACQNIRKLVKYAPGPNKIPIKLENVTIATAKRPYMTFLCSPMVY